MYTTSTTRPPIRQQHGGTLTLAKLLLAAFVREVRASPVPGAVAAVGVELGRRAEEEGMGTQEFYTKLGCSIIFVLVGGVFSGLTLGLMGLDSTNLRVLSSSGTPQQQHDARAVLSLLSRGRHWVLVSLLLGNVVVNETLPVFLDSITGGGGVWAIILSTFLIVSFGEVVPQAICARYGLRIGAWAAPFVLGLMYAEAPLSYPVAKLLDYLLGETHGTVYRKIELKTLVGLHGHIGGDSLSEDEVTIISAVLDMTEKPVSRLMTPINDVYTLSLSTILDHAKVNEILVLGHSRIPVHTPDRPLDFVGMLLVKTLITYDPHEGKTVAEFPLTGLPETLPTTPSLEALNYFQQGISHMLLVSDTPGIEGGAKGVVSLEDVFEEMLGEEVVDETDLFTDNRLHQPVIRRDASRFSESSASSPRRTSMGAMGLAPLLKGIIDRKAALRRESASLSRPGSPSYAAFGSQQATNTPTHPLAQPPSTSTSHSHHHSTTSISTSALSLGGLVNPFRSLPAAANGQGYRPLAVYHSESEAEAGEEEEGSPVPFASPVLGLDSARGGGVALAGEGKFVVRDRRRSLDRARGEREERGRGSGGFKFPSPPLGSEGLGEGGEFVTGGGGEGIRGAEDEEEDGGGVWRRGGEKVEDGLIRGDGDVGQERDKWG